MWTSPDDSTPAEAAATVGYHLDFLTGEHAYPGQQPHGMHESDAGDNDFYSDYIESGGSAGLAKGYFDFQNDTFKMSLFLSGGSMYPSYSYNHWVFSDLDLSAVSEASTVNTSYLTGGATLQNRVITHDAGTTKTTISWDDVIFECGTGRYFENSNGDDLWHYSSNTGWERKVIIALIYNDSHEHKPVIQNFIIPSTNPKYFLTGGDSHTITNIKVVI